MLRLAGPKINICELFEAKLKRNLIYSLEAATTSLEVSLLSYCSHFFFTGLQHLASTQQLSDKKKKFHYGDVKVTLCQHIFAPVLSGEEKHNTLKSEILLKLYISAIKSTKNDSATGQLNKAFNQQTTCFSGLAALGFCTTGIQVFYHGGKKTKSNVMSCYTVFSGIALVHCKIQTFKYTELKNSKINQIG